MSSVKLDLVKTPDTWLRRQNHEDCRSKTPGNKYQFENKSNIARINNGYSHTKDISPRSMRVLPHQSTPTFNRNNKDNINQSPSGRGSSVTPKRENKSEWASSMMSRTPPTATQKLKYSNLLPNDLGGIFIGNHLLLVSIMNRIWYARVLGILITTIILEFTLLTFIDVLKIVSLRKIDKFFLIILRTFLCFLSCKMCLSKIELNSDYHEVIRSLLKGIDLHQLYPVGSISIIFIYTYIIFTELIENIGNKELKSPEEHLLKMVWCLMTGIYFTFIIFLNPRLRRWRELRLANPSSWRDISMWILQSSHLKHSLVIASYGFIICFIFTLIFFFGFQGKKYESLLEKRFLLMINYKNLKIFFISSMLIHLTGVMYKYLCLGVLSKLSKELGIPDKGVPISMTILSNKDFSKYPTKKPFEYFTNFHCLTYINTNSDLLAKKFHVDNDSPSNSSDLWRQFITYTFNQIEELSTLLNENYHIRGINKVFQRYEELELFHERFKRWLLKNGVERKIFQNTFRLILLVKLNVDAMTKLMMSDQNKILNSYEITYQFIEKIAALIEILGEFLVKKREHASFTHEMSEYDQFKESLIRNIKTLHKFLQARKGETAFSLLAEKYLASSPPYLL